MSDLPYKWDLLARYRVIEVVAKWEGRLTTNHLRDTFGIGRQQASKDINTYNKDIAPGNLEYDKQLKGYKPTASFTPKVTTGYADEYLMMLSRSKNIATTFGVQLEFPNTEIIQAPIRNIEPEILRPLVQAAREKRRVDIGYISLNTSDEEERIIVPHTLVCTPMRWHIRAYCEKNGEFRDFVLSRFRGVPDIMDSSEHTVDKDVVWNTAIEILIEPDPRLNDSQREIIAADFGMKDGKLRIATRAALVSYALKSLNIDFTKIEPKAEAQQIVISNLAEI
jgi:predicted DNA-binding transcriptional regulator YafY